MTTETPEKPNKFSHWNPFQSFATHEDALKAAKSGAWICAFLGASYVIQLLFIHYRSKDTFGNEGDLTTIISDIIGVGLAAFLAWRIWTRQGVWATLFVALWFGIELAMKMAAIAIGQQGTNVGYIVMFSALAILAVLAVRGSWKLRSERKASAVQP